MGVECVESEDGARSDVIRGGGGDLRLKRARSMRGGRVKGSLYLQGEEVATATGAASRDGPSGVWGGSAGARGREA